MAYNNASNGRQRQSNKFVPEGGGGWSQQHQSESSKYYSNLNGQQKLILAQLSEMFGQSLDREIILTLATSCDWNVNAAIESLIELSQENGYSAPPPERRRSYEPRTPTKQRSTVPVSPQSATKIAYQGYDDTDDADADIIVEEEEEFEVVKQAPVDHVSRLNAARDAQEQLAQQKTAKQRKQSPIHRAIQAAISNGDRLIVLMRGMPGSGKSYAARQLLANAGIDDLDLLFSTDDYFYRCGRFNFVPSDLPGAHDWNRARVAMAMKQGLSPVIVDNTNTQAWEMKPYLQLAVTHGYIIEMLEPNTPWCWRDAELAQRNIHGVPRQTIRKMIERYERWQVMPLLNTFNLRYNPNNIPPQRCSNPPKRSANIPTLLLRKSTNVTAKPSNVPAKTANGNDSPVKKPSTPAMAIDQQVGMVDLISPARALPQRVKKSDNVDTQSPTNLLHGDTPHSASWDTLLNNNTTSADQVNAREELFEFPPTPPEWIPLTWETIPEIHSMENSSIVDVQTLEASLKESPLDALSTELPLTVFLKNMTLEAVSKELPLEVSSKNLTFEASSKELPLEVASNNLLLEALLKELPLEASSSIALETQISEEVPVEQLIVFEDFVSEITTSSVVKDEEVVIAQELITVELKEEVQQEVEKENLQDEAGKEDNIALKVVEILLDESELLSREAEKDVEEKEDSLLEVLSMTEVVEGVTGDRVGKITQIAARLDEDISIQSVADSQPTDIVNELEPEGDVISMDVDDKLEFSLVHEVPVNVKKTDASDQVSATLCDVPTSSNVQATKSMDIAVSNVPEPDAEVEAKRSPKLNLFAWLFPKKSKSVPNEKPDSSHSERSTWQPYEPQDVETSSINSDPATNVQDKEEEANDSATSEPMSLLLDAAESEQVRDVTIIIDNCEQTSEDKNEPDGNVTVTKVTELVIDDAQAVEMKDSSNEIFLDAVDVSLPIVSSADSSQVDPVNEVEAVDSLDDDIPELSLGTQGSWAKLNPSYVLADEISNSAAVSPIKAMADAAPPKSDAETVTSHADFSLLAQELQTELRVLLSRGRSINTGASLLPPRPRSNVHMLDRGTMTSPMEDEPCDEDFELLVKMFPKIPCEDLTEVFERCGKEINWTVELLMESGYAFEPSPDLEVRFEDSAQLLETQELLEELNSRDSSFIRPLSADPFLGAANVLGVGDSNTKSRHFGLFGSSESLDEAATKPVEIKPPEPRPEAVKSSPTKKAPKKQSQLTLQLKKQMEETFVLNPECYSEETLRIKRIRHGEGSVPKASVEPADEPSRLKMSLTLPGMSGVSSPRLDDMEVDDDDDQDTIPLTLDADFLRHLRGLFGEPMLPGNDEVAVVDLPVALARQIHGYLADSQLRQLEMQEQYFQNMIQDEEFARRLQAEELPPPDLRQIMDMEIALELYRSDSAPRQTEEDLATRLSKQKLAELFPGIDRAMLFDVFEAHGRSFAETLAVLEASTGEVEEAARTVMSPQAMAAYEKRLIDTAKEESSKQTAREAASETDSATPKEQAMNDAKSYRDEANRLYQLRNECYQKANNAQRSGMQSVASYYAQVGHLYKQRIELANSQAASALLSAHSVDNTSTTLDLHYLYVAEALEALDIFLDHHVASLSDRGKTSESIFLITGSGLHSVGGKPKIKPAVQRRLTQRKLRYTEVNSGLLKTVIFRTTQLSSNTK